MSKYSDNDNKPRTNIFDFLPEVYRSDLNEALFETSYNRHLTKDDTVRISGYIGQSNSNALVDRQIQEPTPFRQAFQLQPVMYTKIGSTDHVLTQQGFLKQLELLGVDINRLPVWGNTLQFNWVPPVNIDKLVNYFDYYWATDDPNDPPQYFTIENRCNLARSKVYSYQNIVTQKGALHSIQTMDVKLNQFVIVGDLSDLFTTGFVFFTKNTTDVNLVDRFWTTASSTYDVDANETTIITQENIAIVTVAGDPTPTTTQTGRLWYKSDTNEIYSWTGAVWLLISPALVTASGDISLTELLTVFQRDANCVCNEDYGWDLGLWDDNQPGSVLWNTSLLADISHATEADWIIANGAPTDLALWYDTTNDQLYQYYSGAWNLVFNSFSSVLTLTTGNARWDLTVGCEAQVLNQWSAQNKWIHKSEVQAFNTVKRAQIPILEYNSTIELNEWTRANYAWKYRALAGDAFESIGQGPCVQGPWRLELEPVKGYAAVINAGAWYVYMFERDTGTLNRDINHTAAFTPDSTFRVVNDGGVSQIYTVVESEFRKIKATDPINVVLGLGGLQALTDYYVTVVKIAEPVFTAPTIGGGALNTRVEPTMTSQGDIWRGYHVHWLLDVNATTVVPSAGQAVNPELTLSLEESEAGVNPTYVVTGTGDGQLEIGRALIIFTPDVAGVTTISLDFTEGGAYTSVPPSMYLPSDNAFDLQYDPLESRFYATPGSNELRVFVNGVQQYGTYEENVAYGTPNYTAIGTAVTSIAQIPYVESITFNEPLQPFDVVRIEVCPAAYVDMGMFAVPVRTVEDETAFTAAVAAGTQPEYRSLSQYQYVSQAKTEVNQYPLFNVYQVCPVDLCEEPIIKASPIFAYKEEASCPINSNVQRRIFATADGRDFTFVQYLLDRDDNIIYGYRNLNLAPETGTYWYNTYTKIAFQWNGQTWTNTVFIPTANGTVAYQIVSSDTEPSNLLTKEGSLWMDTANEKLYQRDTIAAVWVEQTSLILASADPTIETIWKNGDNHEYVPEYVDANREPVPVGDPSGDWELLDQWFYNSEHKNKAESKYTQIVTHFRSIIAAQTAIPGLLAGGSYTLTQNQYDLGAGGLMKEHNDSFDTLISAINVTNTTPVGLMEWTEDQYGLGLLFVRDFFNSDITTLYGSFSRESLINQNAFFADDIISQFKLNDYLSVVYGDTTAYDEDSDTGMPNWIATAPIVRLSEKYRPHIMEDDDGTVRFFHHDGHRSVISYTGGEQDRYSRQIIAMSDGRVVNGKLGVLGSTIQPQTEADFLTAFGGTEVRTGVYWYRVGGGFRTLYRFIPYEVTDAAPSFYLDGVELPDGTRYYNTITNLVYIKSGLSWNADTGVAFDISTLWQEVSFAHDFANVVLDIEQRLYDAVPDTDLVFDYSSLTPDASEQAEYDKQYERRFYAFVAERNIKAPLVNTAYSATNAFTWNYINSIVTSPPRLDVAPASAGAWQELYTRWYGTPYPHLEPWKLQGYHDKPTWWDNEYLDPTGGRRWIYDHGTTTGMWENIRIGLVPAGELLPDGTTVSTGAPGETATFNYFSVNIDDVAVGGYDPDELFPPYLSSATAGFSASVRSLFSDIAAEISGPDADYVFGDVGPTEWLWTVSTEYVYDIPIIAFLMQPARFLHYSFGLDFVVVDRLQIETTFCQVYSHEDALFHGDIYNNTETYTANGLNQWYVNFNRSSGYDTSNEFRYLWAGWNPLQSYQFAGIIDTSTLDVAAKYFDVIQEDYNVILANTGVFQDMWAEGFEVSVLNIPPAIIQYNNQALWKFDLDSLAAIDREISYYGVRLYPCTVDTTTNEGTFFTYQVVGVETPVRRFYVSGDQTGVFDPDVQFDVIGSTGNDGTYTTVSSVYEPTPNRTRVNVSEVVPTSIADGQIDVSGFVSPWETGTQVAVSSSRNLPTPFVNAVPYFIIRTGDRTFQLAETYADALANIPIDIITTGDGELRVGEVSATFMVYGGTGNSREVWYHYAIDKDNIRTFTPPAVVQGMQTLINIFDGYAEHQRDQGEAFNAPTAAEYDARTGRAIDWQFEEERFINWAYGLRRTRMQVGDRFQFDVSGATPTQNLAFTDAAPAWTSGTAITFTTTGSLPSPLLAGVVYYFVQSSTPGVFQVSITSNTNVTANIITVTSSGSGTMSVSQYRAQTAFPSLEVNPTRNNIWYDTPLGIMSNVVTGPYADIRVTQTIFDQHGRQLTPDKLNIYRLDKATRISMRPGLLDDLSLIPIQLRDQYDALHLGGGHFFMEGYEHIMLFNDYSVGGALIYDQFYGLYTTLFNMDYFEKEEYTLRPTLGGYYLVDGEFFRNIEGSTVDVHDYYDTYNLREASTAAQYSRHLLGYSGNNDFLDLLGVNSKTQFLFYKGLIQYKGSVAGTIAYTNNRRFIDASVDEFWAWKIADFGDVRPKIYPEIKLLSTDAIQQDVRMHFLGQTETTSDTDVQEAVDNDFVIVDFNEEDRWEIYPEQRAEIMSPLFLDADVSSMYRVYVNASAPTAGQNTVDYWYDGSIFYTWNGGTSGTAADWTDVDDPSNPAEAPFEVNVIGATTYVRMNSIFDTARAVQRKLSISGDLREYETVIYSEGGGITEFDKVNSEIIKFQSAGFTDVMIIFTINPGFSKINPSKLLDKKANTVVDNVQLWDPARGHHSTVAIHNVDLQLSTDPAGYRATENPADVADRVWNDEQVGTVWLDTAELGYKKYYDDKLYSDVNDRLNLWGQLADWANVRVYEWTSSPVPPDEYASIVTVQANDLRPQRSKATGTARQTLFKRTRTPEDADIVGVTSGEQEIDFGLSITSDAASTGLAAGTQGYQDIDFTTTFVGGDATGLVGTGPYQATIYIDGISYLISVTAASAPTYSALLIQINNQLVGSATATIFDTDTIRITSASMGLGSTVIVQDINLFNNLADAPAIPQTSVDGVSTTYTATIEIDGDDYDIAVLGDDAQTFGDLLDLINAQLNGVGFIDLVPVTFGDLIVSSASVGTDSTVSVTDVDLFSSLTGYVGINTATDGTYGQVQVPTGTFAVDDLVLFTTTDTLPEGLESSVKYVVAVVTNAGPFDLLDLVEDSEVNVPDPILISSTGVGQLQAVPAFTDDWIRIPFIRERQYGCMDFTPPTVEPTITLTASVGWAEQDKVDVYVNDVLVEGLSGYILDDTLTIDTTGTGITLAEEDIVDIIRPLRALSTEEEDFDPDTEDDGTVNIQWKYDYEYSSFTTYSGTQSTVATETYYFWVEGSQFRDATEQAGISAQEVATQLETIPTPYFVVQLPKDDPALQAKYGYGIIPYGSTWSLGALPEQFMLIPVYYRQAILRKAASSISQDDRFVWKFTRDLTLRTSLQNSLQPKNKHQEWFMFRREQPSNIPRELWNRLTEALIGYQLTDNTVRVPTLDRELYDALYGTQTRFGLGEDQAFCDKNYALQSILAYLTNPDIDFDPIDIDAFFATYSFDTPANIEQAMEVIYNTFGSTHVNNIWFETLSDALATRAKYKELLKTSWIALHGIRVLEVGGLFDD